MAQELLQNYYSKESTEYQVQPQRLTIFGNHFCPFVQRVLVVLETSNIKYDFVGINLSSKPEWYIRMNPQGLVPYLKLDDKELWESLVIVDYINDKYSLSLHEKDAYLKARSHLLLEKLTKIVLSAIALLKTPTSLESGQKALLETCKALEEVLSARKTKYLQVNERPKYVDLMIYPFFKLIIPIMEIFFENLDSNKVEELLKKTSPSLFDYTKLMANHAEHSMCVSHEVLKDYFKNYVMKRFYAN